jgi:polar amino acid transport system substrate-binding protein
MTGKRHSGFLCNLLAVGILIIGCAELAHAQSTRVSDAARAALPADIRDGGVFRVATSLQWAPFAYKSDKDEAVGIDVSLMKLIAAKLGLKAEFDDLKFPAIIPGVQSGRYHAGVDQLAISTERLKAVDMVQYFENGTSVLMPAGKPIKDANELCGLTFDVTQGSFQIGQLNKLSQACVAAGKKPIAQQAYPSAGDTLLAISNGRGDAFLTATPQGVYITRINSKVELAKGEVKVVDRMKAGIVIQKGNVPLRKAIALALESAIEDGSYKAILNEFGVAGSAVPVEVVRKSAE